MEKQTGTKGKSLIILGFVTITILFLIYSQIGNLIEYPVTLMDAYLFTYMQILEDQIVPTFQRTLDYSRNLENDFGIITVLWHDNVLKMIGGRMYEKIVEFLSSQDDVKICTGIELSNIIKKSIKS